MKNAVKRIAVVVAVLAAGALVAPVAAQAYPGFLPPHHAPHHP